VTAGGACLLTADTETPAVTETTVSTDFPEALEGLAHLGVKAVSVDVGGLAILDVLLPVHEPGGHELEGVLDHGDDLVDLLRAQLSSALLEVNLGLLAHHEGESTANTLDGGEGERGLVAPIDVGVKNTQNVLELVLGEDQANKKFK